MNNPFAIDLDSDLFVKDTEIGRSVFAQRNFEVNELVAEYKGSFVSSNDMAKCLEHAELTGNCFLFEFRYREKRCAIDAHHEDSSKGRLINHSRKNANVLPCLYKHCGEPRLFFKALCNIRKGDELFYDYNDRSDNALHDFPWLQN